MLRPVQSLYEYPLYYDILFGWDRDGEAEFYDACLRRHGVVAGSTVLDVGCGSGQIALRMARLGWRVIGLDLSPDMLAFMSQQGRATHTYVRELCADMCDFTLPEPVSAAYCTLSSVRMLASDEELVAHLRAVRSALRPGGVYVLDLTFEEPGVGTADDEAWTMSRGPVVVAASERGFKVTDPAREGTLELGWGPPLRPCGAEEFLALLKRAGGLEPRASHPDVRTSEDEVSTFDVERGSDRPEPGRLMLVLGRPEE